MKKPLNPNAQKWVAALRSGEYKQGRSYLSVDGAFCCLGVACAVFQKEVGGLREELHEPLIAYDQETACLPGKVKYWLGLCSEWGSFGDTGLYELNDRHCKSFSEIADIIESQPEGLFV